MADTFTIGSNAAQLLRRYNRLPGDVQRGIARGMKRGLLLAEDHVRRNTKIRARHGMAGLMGRLTSDVEIGGPLGIDGVIGFRKTRGFPYELAQEYGARARPGGAMTMPLTAEARRAGSPRAMAGLFVLKGQPYLAEKTGPRTITRHWRFLKKIEPRLFFRQSVRESLPRIGQEIVKDAEKATR